jgi:hypothetical protein
LHWTVFANSLTGSVQQDVRRLADAERGQLDPQPDVIRDIKRARIGGCEGEQTVGSTATRESERLKLLLLPFYGSKRMVSQSIVATQGYSSKLKGGRRG